MTLMRLFLGGLKALFHRDQRSRELDEELSSYLEAAIQEKVRGGMSYTDAIRAARVEMGSMEAAKQEVRSSGWESVAESLWQDIRYGVRQLLRSRGFSTVAIVTLALGIGANTAIFSVVYGVLLQPLPFRDAARLVLLHETTPRIGDVSVS